MKGFKSPVSRLALLFRKSRDRWKERIIEKQKKIRYLEVKVRDLSKSRDKWKQEAKDLKQEISRIKKEHECKQNSSGEKATDSKTEDDDCHLLLPSSKVKAMSRPEGHLYPTFIIQLAIQLYTQALSSFRGSEKTFEIFSQVIGIPTPSFDIIRKWIFRVGMYELTKEKEFRSDWIIIFDHTIELGQVKCLVILGIPMEKLQLTGFCLQHQDVEILDIEIMSSSTGQTIYQKLTTLSENIGTPLQIVSDHGPDLHKGIRLFHQEHPSVIYTYDITHKMASLFKQELEEDERFKAFMSKCASTIKQIQQTELHFLAPPKQRIKSRYLNIDKHVEWANNVLSYQKRGDFSQISPTFTLQAQDISALEGQVDDRILDQLLPMVTQKYAKGRSFNNELIHSIGQQAFDRVGKIIFEAADVGKKRFIEKLGWLAEYEEDISIYSQMVHLAHEAEKQVKHQGLSQKSRQSYEQNTEQIIIINERVHNFKGQIIEYLTEEGNKIPENQTLLASSDIIESIFGKYKNFSAKNPIKEVGKMILTIPVFTSKIKDIGFVKKALETVKFNNVEEWAKRVLGQSMHSKRINAFNPHLSTQG